MKDYNHWSDDDAAALEGMAGDGTPYAEMAVTLRRSVKSVCAKLRAIRAMAGAFQSITQDGDLFNHDAEYVADCLAGGGFPALSERRVGLNGVRVCLPMIWPART